ncbi:MAG TPA: GNAT family N-acetyltransferase [Phycisphaerae bacterium]|nr:GNAT family N-acetyltransferase [Phycisphaerae bacterium]
MRIERAGTKDAVQVVQKVEQLLTELGGKPYSLDWSGLVPVIQAAIGDGRYTVLVARDDDAEIVGVLTLGEVVAAYAGGRFGVIHELHVSPQCRSAGIGNSLLKEAKIICRQRGWVRLEVGAPPYPKWSRTKDFYVRAGFAEIGPRLKWIAEQSAGADTEERAAQP